MKQNTTITAKIKLYATKEQKALIQETINAYTVACNYISEIVFESKQLIQPKLHAITYPTLRAEYNMKSQMALSVMRTVIARYRSAKSNKHQWSLINFNRGELDLVWNRDYSLTKDGFFSLITHTSGRIKIPYEAKGVEKYFTDEWSFGTCKVVVKSGALYLYIPITKEIDKYDITACNDVIGVDLGINFTAVSYGSNGKTFFFKGRHIKDKRAQFIKTRKELQRRGTASSRRRLREIGQRETRWMNDVNHVTSKALVANCKDKALIVLEDLHGVRNATEKVCKQNRYISVSWAFFDLRQKIEYKAELAGKKAITVDPKYTSQSCPKCGNTDRYNRDKRNHTFKCKGCGYTSNDDRIGAMNLWNKGIAFVSKETIEINFDSTGHVNVPTM
ncbi:MAG: transposase [Paludibacter sp.]|nr:transposase [Paludibacter sp.]